MFDDNKLECPLDFDCSAIVEKFLTVYLPVTTTPSAKVGKIKTECCGNPMISLKPPLKCCDTLKDESCHFTIVQKMKIEIPISFNAITKTDDLCIDCEFKHDTNHD